MNFGADPARLPPVLAETFVGLKHDEETAAFVQWCRDNRLSIARTLRLMRSYGKGVSKYDIDAREQAYRMFLLSNAQWRELLFGVCGPRALDIGAGQGFITERLKPFAETLCATELGPHLVSVLESRGIEAYDLDLSRSRGNFEPGSFDLVFLLNVLDRTPQPRDLLRAVDSLLAPAGTLVLATPLPYRNAEAGSAALIRQNARVRWEDAAADFYQRVLEPLHLVPIRWSRAPYISQGTFFTPFYALDDAVFVLRRSGSESDRLG